MTKWMNREDKHGLLSPFLMIHPFRRVKFIYVRQLDCHGKQLYSGAARSAKHLMQAQPAGETRL